MRRVTSWKRNLFLYRLTKSIQNLADIHILSESLSSARPSFKLSNEEQLTELKRQNNDDNGGNDSKNDDAARTLLYYRKDSKIWECKVWFMHRINDELEGRARASLIFLPFGGAFLEFLRNVQTSNWITHHSSYKSFAL